MSEPIEMLFGWCTQVGPSNPDLRSGGAIFRGKNMPGHPFPSNRHHQSNDDCPEGKRENYQVCSVQYYVQKLCTVQCTHTHMNRPNSCLLVRISFSVVILCVTVYLF